jgi:hypothetical protein
MKGLAAMLLKSAAKISGSRHSLLRVHHVVFSNFNALTRRWDRIFNNWKNFFSMFKKHYSDELKNEWEVSWHLAF